MLFGNFSRGVDELLLGVGEALERNLGLRVVRDGLDRGRVDTAAPCRSARAPR